MLLYTLKLTFFRRIYRYIIEQNAM